MSEKKVRRVHASDVKATVLREVLKERKNVSDVCREHDISVSLFYTWQNEAFERLTRVFDDDKGESAHKRAQAKIDELQRTVEQKDDILFQLMERHVALKKKLGLS